MDQYSALFSFGNFRCVSCVWKIRANPGKFSLSLARQNKISRHSSQRIGVLLVQSSLLLLIGGVGTKEI